MGSTLDSIRLVGFSSSCQNGAWVDGLIRVSSLSAYTVGLRWPLSKTGRAREYDASVARSAIACAYGFQLTEYRNASTIKVW
ncbi:hypothetical protein TgHK011_004696 [Trichoderma gracile]|nr:hypothetical protein TgHK011_004696 [Trichoderma gracile]